MSNKKQKQVIHKIIKKDGITRYKCNPFIKIIKGRYTNINSKVTCKNCKR